MNVNEIQLNQLDLSDLKLLQKKVAAAIASFEDRKREEALEAIEETARGLGYTLHELTGVSSKKRRAPAMPKYRNPADESQVWSGRGRRPRWLEEALQASGASLADFEIQ